MSTTTTKTAIPDTLDARVAARILEEGYGPGAWHGADMKAAIADVSPKLAFWRPSSKRHNIAEIVLHHAYCVRNVRGQLSGETPEPFLVDGDDWFLVDAGGGLTWPRIQKALDDEQRKLSECVGKAGRGSALKGVEPFDLVLGAACHAIYHAGQIQLIKRLHGASTTQSLLT